MAGKPIRGGKKVTRKFEGRVCKQVYKKKPKKAAKPNRKPKRRISRKKGVAPKGTKRVFLNAFFLFLREFRKTCPLKTIQIAKLAGAVWRTMSSIKKAPYENKSKALMKNIKEAREIEMKDRKKKPLNAFFLFLQEYKKTCKNCKITDMAKSAGAAWRAMSETEKAVYINKAKHLRSIEKKAGKPAKVNKEPDGKEDVDKSGTGKKINNKKKSQEKNINEETPSEKGGRG